MGHFVQSLKFHCNDSMCWGRVGRRTNSSFKSRVWVSHQIYHPGAELQAKCVKVETHFSCPVYKSPGCETSPGFLGAQICFKHSLRLPKPTATPNQESPQRAGCVKYH